MPVPCASTYWMPSGSMPKRAYTSVCNCCCASALGAVMPLVAPSWLMPLPTITPWIRSPSARASSSRLSTSTATASPDTMPLARSSKVWHLPSAASICALPAAAPKCGVACRNAPPARIRSVSWLRRLSHPRWIATSELEQAVSIVTAGPFRFRKYATRAGRIEGAVPQNEWPTSSSRT
ncbi:putative aT-less polyketide synthase [Burkholderia gladioli]|uniref:AT-less polyketide synthase n=1 Tax=Burkholderia gladioli TaxID=28095 RepID=A0AAW3FCT2_BURGA|nr:putative aT-less polyketide synthase [Burkholderia gladioli]